MTSSNPDDPSNRYPLVDKWYHQYKQEKGSEPNAGFLIVFAKKHRSRLSFQNVTEYLKCINDPSTTSATTSSKSHKNVNVQKDFHILHGRRKSVADIANKIGISKEEKAKETNKYKHSATKTWDINKDLGHLKDKKSISNLIGNIENKNDSNVKAKQKQKQEDLSMIANTVSIKNRAASVSNSSSISQTCSKNVKTWDVKQEFAKMDRRTSIGDIAANIGKKSANNDSESRTHSDVLKELSHVSVKNKWDNVLKNNVDRDNKNKNKLIQEKCKDLQTLSNASIKNRKLAINNSNTDGNSVTKTWNIKDDFSTFGGRKGSVTQLKSSIASSLSEIEARKGKEKIGGVDVSEELSHVSVKQKTKEITSNRYGSDTKFKPIKKTWDSEEDFETYTLEIASIEERIETIQNKLKQDFKEKERFDVKDEESDDDNKIKERTDVIEIESDTKEIISNFEKLSDKLSICQMSNVITNVEMKSNHSFVDHRFGSYFTPLNTNDPILNISLDSPFDTWSNHKQCQFIYELSKLLDVNPYQLVPISVSNGSTKLGLLVCNVIAKEFPSITKKFVSATTQMVNQVKDSMDKKMDNFFKKWHIKTSQMTNFFQQKILKNENNNTTVQQETQSGIAVTSASTVVNSDSANTNANTTATTESRNGEVTEVENWFLSQAKSLKKILRKALQNCSQEYEILSIMILDNEKCLNNFIATKNYQNSKVLYHGTKIKHLSEIFKSGFNDKFIGSATDPGWYGKGHYFSSLPQYCMPYCQENEFGQRTLVVSYVNCGNILNVYENNKYFGKTILNEYESHYVRVTPNGMAVPQKDLTNYEFGVNMFDEYVVKSGKFVLPRFCVTFVQKSKLILWRDGSIYKSMENSKILSDLTKKYGYNIYGAKTTQDALKVFEKKRRNSQIYVITNGGDKSEEFIDVLRKDFNCKENILVFTGSYEYKDNYSRFENVKVTINPSDVYQFVKENLNDSTMVDASNVDDADCIDDAVDVDGPVGNADGINSNTKSDTSSVIEYSDDNFYTGAADTSVIMDNGSGMTRVGCISSENDSQVPQKVFPTVVARLHNDSIMNQNYSNPKKSFICDEISAIPKGLSKERKYPIEYGKVNDWDTMEQIWQYTFDSLECEPCDNNILLTEVSGNPKPNREKAIQIMFETFGTPCFYIIPQSWLRLIETGS